MTRLQLVFVGAGPRTLSVLERLSASLPGLAPGLELDVHVIDPHPAGAGRIWRREQSPLLWMNSTAADITVFTDDTVTCAGPIRPGPSLLEWSQDTESPLLPGDFAPRQTQSDYLGWAWQRVLRSLPTGVAVHEHAESAVALDEVRRVAGVRQRVTLASSRQLDADAVVLAQGYLAQRPTLQQRQWVQASARHGLTYLPPGYTADLDLSVLRPGEAVLVRGLGLAFIDLCVLIGEGRGGHFTGDGTQLTYHPSGAEPVLYAGSRRGVPYHAKLGYDLGAAGPTTTRHLTLDALAGTGTLDFDTSVWPLVARELADVHYRRLFAAHPERTRGDWAVLEQLIAISDVRDPAFLAAAARQVPDPHDRFDLALLDRPWQGRHWASRASYEHDLLNYIHGDLTRRSSPEFSADRAVFDSLLSIYGVLATLASQGRLSPSDRVLRLEHDFHGFFSYLASGPPPRRLAELVALHRAGVVRFLGPDLRVSLGACGFAATSPAVDGLVTASALVDAHLPRPDAHAITDPLIRGLLRRGELSGEGTDDGVDHRGGQLRADERCRAIRADGSSHPQRFLVGPAIAGSVGSGGFTRPRFNGASLRQNDALARDLIAVLCQQRAARPLIDPTCKEQRHAS